MGRPEEASAPLGAPSPEETGAMQGDGRRRVEALQRHPSLRRLEAFARGQVGRITQKGDQATNIIDQDKRRTYNLEEDGVSKLLAVLDSVRREGGVTHWSERQGTPAAPTSGVMLDYDVLVNRADAALGELDTHRIACRVGRYLREDLVFPAAASGNRRDVRLHVYSILKPATKKVDEGLWKYGFHLLVPAVRVTRAYKKYLLRRLREDEQVGQVLSRLGAVGDLRECLDMNSASVPVLFVGSCKRGGTPYRAGPIVELAFDARVEGGATVMTSDFMPLVTLRKPGELEAAGYNLVAEAALCSEARYEGGRPPFSPAFECEPTADVVAEIGEHGRRDGAVPDDEVLLAEHSLSLLALHNPEARHLHQILDLLGPEYYTERNRWRNVVYALANTDPGFKPLAEWFSQKCPAKWADGGRESLDTLWEEAVTRRGAVERPLTKRSLFNWARQCNPEKYAEITDQGYFRILTDYVYKYGGVLEHFMVARVLYAMLGSKFVVDYAHGEPELRNGRGYAWFEFVVPGQAARPGEVWKWRLEPEPDEVSLYISEQLSKVYDQVAQHIEEKQDSADTEDRKRYYTKLGGRFATSRGKIFNHGFKAGVLREAIVLFRRRGFYEGLDKDPLLLGVSNGVLRLGATSSLIDHFHEFPVRRFSPVPYRKFDPTNPFTKIMLDAIGDIFPEPDARDLIMFHAAQSLRGGLKEGLVFLIKGGGANGKTWFMRMVEKAVGSQYAKKLDIGLLTSTERPDPSRPNSALMQLDGARYGYFEETNKSEHLNTQRLKEVANPGAISSRDLNASQKSFEITANLFAGQNYPFVISTKDHGTWRRIYYYEAKVRFCSNPDPENPLEKKDDPRFVQEYVNDPEFQASFLSILVHYYERLHREYGGVVKRVKSETIERETEIFRNSQDTLNRYITQSIVRSPAGPGNEPTAYELTEVAAFYQEWFNRNINQQRLTVTDTIKDIENSALRNLVRYDPQTQKTQLTGCRVLTAEEPLLRPGETRFGNAGSLDRHDIAAFYDMLRKPRGNWWEGPALVAVQAPPRSDDDGEAPVFVEDDAVLAEAAASRAAESEARRGLDSAEGGGGSKSDELDCAELGCDADELLDEGLSAAEAEDAARAFAAEREARERLLRGNAELEAEMRRREESESAAIIAFGDDYE